MRCPTPPTSSPSPPRAPPSTALGSGLAYEGQLTLTLASSLSRCASVNGVLGGLGGLFDLDLKCGSRLSWLPAIDTSVARDELLASLRAGSALDGAQLDALEQARYLVITPCTCMCTVHAHVHVHIS